MKISPRVSRLLSSNGATLAIYSEFHHGVPTLHITMLKVSQTLKPVEAFH